MKKGQVWRGFSACDCLHGCRRIAAGHTLGQLEDPRMAEGRKEKRLADEFVRWWTGADVRDREWLVVAPGVPGGGVEVVAEKST